MEVFTWGSGEMGQLGVENHAHLQKDEEGYPYQPMPTCINNLSHCINIAGGDGHTCAVDVVSGGVYSWGASACGQLGLPEMSKMPKDGEGFSYQPIPLRIPSLSHPIMRVSCGDAHTLAVSIFGEVFAWGGGGCGQLGISDTANMPTDDEGCPFLPDPQKISALSNVSIIDTCCGKAHSIALDDNGVVYSWGAGACGQLGQSVQSTMTTTGHHRQHSINIINDHYNFSNDEDGYPYQPIPKPLLNFSQYIVQIASGDVHNLCRDIYGDVYVFGGGSCGQLGIENHGIEDIHYDQDNCPFITKPTKISKLQKIIHIACGDSHSIDVDFHGKIWVWGSNSCGQLGVPSAETLDSDDYYDTTEDEEDEGTNAIIIEETNTMTNRDGDHRLMVKVPIQIDLTNDMNHNTFISHVSCGEAHTIIYFSNNQIYTWGANFCGQLGQVTLGFNLQNNARRNNPYKQKKQPASISLNQPLHEVPLNIVSIASGGVHNCLVCSLSPFNIKFIIEKIRHDHHSRKTGLNFNRLFYSPPEEAVYKIECIDMTITIWKTWADYIWNSNSNQTSLEDILTKHLDKFLNVHSGSLYLFLSSVFLFEELPFETLTNSASLSICLELCYISSIFNNHKILNKTKSTITSAFKQFNNSKFNKNKTKRQQSITGDTGNFRLLFTATGEPLVVPKNVYMGLFEQSISLGDHTIIDIPDNVLDEDGEILDIQFVEKLYDFHDGYEIYLDDFIVCKISSVIMNNTHPLSKHCKYLQFKNLIDVDICKFDVEIISQFLKIRSFSCLKFENMHIPDIYTHGNDDSLDYFIFSKFMCIFCHNHKPHTHPKNTDEIVKIIDRLTELSYSRDINHPPQLQSFIQRQHVPTSRLQPMYNKEKNEDNIDNSLILEILTVVIKISFKLMDISEVFAKGFALDLISYLEQILIKYCVNRTTACLIVSLYDERLSNTGMGDDKPLLYNICYKYLIEYYHDIVGLQKGLDLLSKECILNLIRINQSQFLSTSKNQEYTGFLTPNKNCQDLLYKQPHNTRDDWYLHPRSETDDTSHRFEEGVFVNRAETSILTGPLYDP